MLYAETAKTLRGLIGLLSDPEAKIQETLKRIMTTEHDPEGKMGWRTSRGEPTRTHPMVAESMREVLDKAEKERSAVVSEVVKRLPLYRDPLIDAATATSDFRLDDLVNREQPASLYLVVPWESRDRLKPLTRLIINQIVRRLTAKLEFKDGRPVSPHRRPLLLMLDEFGLLGRFEVFAEAMSHMAGFGLRACLAVQSFSQIYKPTAGTKPSPAIAIRPSGLPPTRWKPRKKFPGKSAKPVFATSIARKRAAAAASPNPKWAAH